MPGALSYVVALASDLSHVDLRRVAVLQTLRVAALAADTWGASRPVEMVGQHTSYVSLLARLQRIAAYDEPVLISGESGSGKESLAQAREAAALDARTAVTQYEQAQAAYAASVGTDEQAGRAYRIAEVRQQEGISTQVELLQARTQYEQARLNRVLAARDLEVARLRVAFLKDLPVSVRR